MGPRIAAAAVSGVTNEDDGARPLVVRPALSSGCDMSLPRQPAAHCPLLASLALDRLYPRLPLTEFRGFPVTSLNG